MKRFGVLAVLCLLAALVASATAGASGTALTPNEKNLQKQLNTIQKAQTAQGKKITALAKNDAFLLDGIRFAIAVDECTNAATADALQGTWTIINDLATKTAQPTYFPVATPVDDSGVCTALGVTRSQVSPPTVGTLDALLALIRQSAVLTRHIAL